MPMTPQVLSPANSTFLHVAISEDEAQQELEQQYQQEHAISSGGDGVGAVSREDKKAVDDHEDDSLIEIDDDDDETVENDEAYEVIHLSDDTDVVEGGPRLTSKNHASAGKVNIFSAEAKNLSSENEIPTTANKNVQPPTPKLVIEKTVAEQIPHASPEKSTSATAGERDNDLPEYSVR